MQTQKNKAIIVFMGIIALVFTIVLIVLSLTRKNEAPEQEEPYIYGFEESDIITDNINTDITTEFPEEVSAPYDLKNQTIYGVTGEFNKENDNIWIGLSNDEWMAYAVEDKKGLHTFETALRNITQTPIFHINTEVDQTGYIGISYGGYRAGTVTVDETHYYIMQYYVESSLTCAYITTNEEKINNGKALIEKNILTMIDDASSVNGTDDDFESNYSEEEEALIQMELYNNAYYQDMTINNDFNKMRLLFTTKYFDRITKIYMRNVRTHEVYYPIDSEEHDANECVFVVDNVHQGDKFQIVMFAEKDPGKPKAAPMEYEESETVKRRSASGNATSENRISENTINDGEATAADEEEITENITEDDATIEKLNTEDNTIIEVSE